MLSKREVEVLSVNGLILVEVHPVDALDHVVVGQAGKLLDLFLLCERPSISSIEHSVVRSRQIMPGISVEFQRRLKL